MSENARKVEVYTDAGGNYRVRVRKDGATRRLDKPSVATVARQSRRGRTVRSSQKNT